MKKDNFIKGEGYVSVCLIVILLSAILTTILTYSASVAKVNVMIENSKVVLDSFVTQNSVEIYQSIKQGNDYTEVINEDEYRTALIDFCILEENGDKLYSINEDGTERFNISNPVITFREEKELKLVTSYTLSFPLSFAGISFNNVSIPIEISSILTEKF